MKKSTLQAMYPKLTYFFQLKNVPSHYVSKSQLVRDKKWKEGILPVAVKGNSKVGEGFYFLYDSRLFT